MLRHALLNESAVVSPISVIFTLVMLQTGANGITKMQINELIAKATLFGKQFNVQKDYMDRIVEKYHSQVDALDFSKLQEAAEVINGFVNKSTEGKIRDLVNADTVKVDAVSLVVDAIYFTAEWLQKFYSSSNSSEVFYSAENVSRGVEFMNDFQVHGQYAEDDEVEVLSLPYQDDSYAFNIILPKKRWLVTTLRFSIFYISELCVQISFLIRSFKT
ncbi:unnamed protein product [Angiostrongylus costaricensis]|uniref:SERPIN domain-containing protein n=1 Tax=Angiostrongylus costaricensis TaxID=334426 RepID=A0A0R3Q0E8_ANGCS|nr:unnamed protein product [Angiostrongylus costaricensis]